MTDQQTGQTALQTATGVIETLSTKQVKGYQGKPAYLHSLKIQGTWYNNGFKAPGFSEGDCVTVSFIVDQYGNAVQGIARAQMTAEQQAAQAPQATGSSTSTTRKDVTIVRQNALTQANAMHRNLVASGTTLVIDAQAVIAEAKAFEAYVLGE